eukprot:6176313-Pleurochrysis_carterae.AAC.3
MLEHVEVHQVERVSTTALEIEMGDGGHVEDPEMVPFVPGLWHAVLHVILSVLLLLGVSQLLKCGNVVGELLLRRVVAAAGTVDRREGTAASKSWREMVETAAHVVRLHHAPRALLVALDVLQHGSVGALGLGIGGRIGQLDGLLGVLVLRALGAFLATAPYRVRAHVHCKRRLHCLEVSRHCWCARYATAISEMEHLAIDELVEAPQRVGRVLAQ